MADDLPELKREVARLRGELDHVLQILREEKPRPEQSRVLPLEGGALFIRHGKEKPLLVLKAEQGQAAIYLNDPEGRPRGVFQVDAEGARLEIWNKEQQVVLSIGETQAGAGEIYVAGADGKPRAGLKVTPAGGVVSAQNPDGHVNALMIGKTDGGTIVVADADGRPLVEIAATSGQGTVTIKQASGAEAAALTSDEKGGALAIFDRAGRLLSSSNFPP
jgi:hypothetical protein